jgi:hypothetical protein
MEIYEKKMSEEFTLYYENVNVDDKSKNIYKNIVSLLRIQFKNLYFQGELIKNSERYKDNESNIAKKFEEKKMSE